jgi:hypothetical protein
MMSSDRHELSNGNWPRFQFRLRSMMVVVTLAAVPCAYLGWQATIVRQRRAELERTVDLQVVGIDATDKEGIISFVRRLLGDKRVATIMKRRTDQLELERLRRIFPEARVEAWTPAMPTSIYR